MNLERQVHTTSSLHLDARSGEAYLGSEHALYNPSEKCAKPVRWALFHPVLVKHMIDQAKGIFAEGQHLHRLIIHISLKAKDLFSGFVLTN